MRVLAGAFGIFMFGVGLLFLGFGAASAVQTSDNLGSTGSDWTCTADGTSSRCDLGIGGVPRDHAGMMGDLASTVAGGALAVSGAIFILIGFGTPRPLAPPPAAPTGPAGPAGQHRPPHPGQHQPQYQAPPTGPQPTGQQQPGQQQPGPWPSAPPASGDPGQPGPR